MRRSGCMPVGPTTVSTCPPALLLSLLTASTGELSLIVQDEDLVELGTLTPEPESDVIEEVSPAPGVGHCVTREGVPLPIPPRIVDPDKTSLDEKREWDDWWKSCHKVLNPGKPVRWNPGQDKVVVSGTLPDSVPWQRFYLLKDPAFKDLRQHVWKSRDPKSDLKADERFRWVGQANPFPVAAKPLKRKNKGKEKQVIEIVDSEMSGAEPEPAKHRGKSTLPDPNAIVISSDGEHE